jgi:hypothetical protein
MEFEDANEMQAKLAAAAGTTTSDHFTNEHICIFIIFLMGCALSLTFYRHPWCARVSAIAQTLTEHITFPPFNVEIGRALLEQNAQLQAQISSYQEQVQSTLWLSCGSFSPLSLSARSIPVTYT